MAVAASDEVVTTVTNTLQPNGEASKIEASAPSKAPSNSVFQRVLQINDSLRLHLYGTQLILESGLMLNVPQITISKAQIIFHRFYYEQDRDLKDYPPFHIAMTCTYLASKLDENTRRHRDILTVFDRIYKKRNSTPKAHLRTIDPHGKRYSIWKENLFNFEIRVLASMGFTCSVDSAHKYLLQLLVDLLATEPLAKQSWALLNDLHRVPQILDHSCLEVAASCILLAARRLQIKLPDDPSWCELFGVDKDKLLQIASVILEILELPENAFKLKDDLKESDETLDCNPQTVKKQMKIQHQVESLQNLYYRIQEKQKRLKAQKLKNLERQNSASTQSSIDPNDKINKINGTMNGTQSTAPTVTKKVVLTKMVKDDHINAIDSKLIMTNPSNGIKTINLKSIGTLTPPQQSAAEKDAVTAVAKLQSDKSKENPSEKVVNDHEDKEQNDRNGTEREDKEEVKRDDDHQGTGDEEGPLSSDTKDDKSSSRKKRKRDRSRKSGKRDRDKGRRRDRDRDKDRRRKSYRHSPDRKRRHRSRRRSVDYSSSDSDYYRSRHRESSRRRHRSRRDRDRDRDRRDRSYSYSPSRSPRPRRSVSGSRSRSPRSDRGRSRSKSPRRSRSKSPHRSNDDKESDRGHDDKNEGKKE